MTLIRLLGRSVRPYGGLLALLVVLQLLSTIASLILPSLNADIIDDGILTGNVGLIWRLGGWMLLASAAQVAASIGATWCAAKIAMGVGRDLRASVFGQVQTFSSTELHAFGAPTLITRATNDVQQIQLTTFLLLSMMLMAPITGVGGVIMAIREDPGLSWLIAVAVPVMLIGLGGLMVKLVPRFRRMQERLDDVNRVMREQIQGIRVVRAFVREPQERERFGEVNEELTQANLAAGRIMVMMFPLVMLVLNASQVGVMWFGGLRIDAGQMQIGALTAFLSYLIQILMAVMMATMVATMLPRASVASERITEVLTTTSRLTPADPGASRARGDAEPGAVRFEQVTMTHPGATHPVLDEVSFTCPPGTWTAVVGGTGSGKSTLISLIPRLIDPTSGRVLLSGEDLRSIPAAEMASRIALVPQTSWLFAGTIADNLRFGDPHADDTRLWDALEDAQAAGFVRALDKGLEAEVTQGGSNLSGGQRQRLAIARALVAQAEVYLFDDSFSALDLATEASLRRAIRSRLADATVIVVSQRIASVRDADQIVVLDDGRVVGLGRHEDLVTSSATYAEIVASQAEVDA